MSSGQSSYVQVVSKHYTTVHTDETNCIFVLGGVTDSSSDIKIRQIRGNHLGAAGKLIVIVLLNTDINDCKHPLNVFFSFISTKMLETGEICFRPFAGALTALAVSQVWSRTALIPRWTPGTLHEGLRKEHGKASCSLRKRSSVLRRHYFGQGFPNTLPLLLLLITSPGKLQMTLLSRQLLWFRPKRGSKLYPTAQPNASNWYKQIFTCMKDLAMTNFTCR